MTDKALRLDAQRPSSVKWTSDYADGTDEEKELRVDSLFLPPLHPWYPRNQRSKEMVQGLVSEPPHGKCAAFQSMAIRMRARPLG